MIRLLIVLLIVALSLKMLSGMLTEEEQPRAPEDALLGEAYEPHQRAQQFSEEDYEEALDVKRDKLDEQIDGGE
jgi:hypothetical protein